MNKALKIVLNVLLVLVALGSVVMGFLLRGLNCWGAGRSICELQDMGYWPFLFWIIVPCVSIVALVIVNKKK